MNFLITGGAGSVGTDLAASLLGAGHAVKVLDKAAAPEAGTGGARPEWLTGCVEDPRLAAEAVRGADAVVHLAWSFSDDPFVLLESDLKGQVVLLDACVAARVPRFFYASTAVVYGKPLGGPLTEDARCLIEDARKPFYAVAKLAAEHLALIYGRTKSLPSTVFRFWWSFGRTIGGKHLRDLISRAGRNEPLRVPEGAGGSFLDHDDLTHALLRALERPGSAGEILNLATLYLEWKDVAEMIVGITGSSSPVVVVPRHAWDGAEFLADPWNLSTAKAARLLGWRTSFAPEAARHRLRQAIEACHLAMAAA